MARRMWLEKRRTAPAAVLWLTTGSRANMRLLNLPSRNSQLAKNVLEKSRNVPILSSSSDLDNGEVAAHIQELAAHLDRGSE